MNPNISLQKTDLSLELSSKLQSISFSINQLLISSRHQTETKSDQMQNKTALNLDLPLLVSSARLYEMNLLPQQACYLQIVQTPVAHRRNFVATMDQYCPVNQQSHEIHSPILFPTLECEQSESNAQSQEESQIEKQDSLNDQNMNACSKEFQNDNEEEEIPQTPLDFRRTSQITRDDSNQKDSDSKKWQCKCKKTQCLKLYCDCFKLGQYCGSDCQCQDCHNTPSYEKQREQAKKHLLKRNSDIFRPKIEQGQHALGCNCKKTGCIKKYCECFQANLSCGSNCQCEECKNCVEKNKNISCSFQRLNTTVKKQSRMREHQ